MPLLLDVTCSFDGAFSLAWRLSEFPYFKSDVIDRDLDDFFDGDVARPLDLHPALHLINIEPRCVGDLHDLIAGPGLDLVSTKLLVSADLEKSPIWAVEPDVLDGAIGSNGTGAWNLDPGRARNWLYGFALHDLVATAATCRHDHHEGQNGKGGMSEDVHGVAV